MEQEEIERNVSFIINQQATFFAEIEQLKELGKQTDARLDAISKRLSRAIRLGVAEARQEREKRRQLEESFTGKLHALIDAQIKTEGSLSTFKSQMEESSSTFKSQMEESSSTFKSQMEESLSAFQSQVRQSLAETEAQRVRGEEQLRQGLAAMQSQVGQALAEMAQAITATNRRFDDLTKTNGQL